MRIPVITNIVSDGRDSLAVLRSIYVPDPANISGCVLHLRADGEVAAYGEPVAARFKADRPTGDDRIIANKVAAVLGVPDDAEWWAYATIVGHPLDGEIAARLLPIMAEEQRILAQLREVRERLCVDREKVEGLRFVEVSDGE